jgi:putative PIN family toxin of toxin-antitoxin system
MSRGSEKLTIVVDTNLFFSGIVFKRGNPFALLEAWRAETVVVLLSEDQRNELIGVLSRPEITRRYRLDSDELADLYARLDRAPRVTPIITIPVSVRDPKDEHILAAAMGGDADYLVTGDADLLVLRGSPSLGRLQIVTVVEFLTELTPPEETEA